MEIQDGMLRAIQDVKSKIQNLSGRYCPGPRYSKETTARPAEPR